ncbi:MAG: hypothetical protein R2810_00605 [Flavobacteriales bacterium]
MANPDWPSPAAAPILLRRRTGNGRHQRQAGGYFVAVIGMGFPTSSRAASSATRDRRDRLSRPIVLIAVLGIVIGMAVMMITVSIGTGFQREMVEGNRHRHHLQMRAIAQTDPKETQRVSIRQDFLPPWTAYPGWRTSRSLYRIPGIIETGERSRAW